MNERKIIIGLITSKKYLTEIKDIWDNTYIESAAAKRIAIWCWEHFNIHNNAIGSDVTDKFFSELKKGKIPKDIAEELEVDILPSLSKEHLKKSIRTKTLLLQTKKYFAKRKIELLKLSIDDLLNKGEIENAESLVTNFTPLSTNESDDLDFSDKDILMKKIERALDSKEQNVIYYPKQAGEFLNEHLVRGGFVAFLGKEKIGKTWLLLDLVVRALKQHKKVAFFQAGDMNETQQLIRIAVKLAGKSNKEKYCGKQYEPIRDCVYNLSGITCKYEKVRETNAEAPFQGTEHSEIRKKNKQELIEAYNLFKEHKPCYNCKAYNNGGYGATWLRRIDVGDALTVNEAKVIFNDFFINNKRNLKLSTHPSDTLTVENSVAILKGWKKEGFVPEVIVFDYPDIMKVEGTDERQKQNKTWKGLRALSQEDYLPLVIAVTQADALSYEKMLLNMKNFSEDKRKYGHVTAMWGMNQDPKGIEAALGILRLNELVLREGEKTSKVLTLLQNLKRGKAYSQAYF